VTPPLAGKFSSIKEDYFRKTKKPNQSRETNPAFNFTVVSFIFLIISLPPGGLSGAPSFGYKSKKKNLKKILAIVRLQFGGSIMPAPWVGTIVLAGIHL
jgi:hypothetical protein